MVKIHKTMEKLKVGDRVEIMVERYTKTKGIRLGDIATVCEVSNGFITARNDYDTFPYFFDYKDVMLVETKPIVEEQTSFETQKKQVLAHLQSKPITSWEAINTYRITRLSAVIYELRKTHTITSEWEHNGKKRWTKYTLIK